MNCFQPFTKNYSKIHVLGHAASEPCSNVISYSIHIASLLVKFIHTPSNYQDISKKKSSHPGHNVAPCTNRSWGACLNRTTVWLNSTQSGSWKDGVPIKTFYVEMQYTSFQFFQLAWDGQALLHRANLTCFCVIGYILKAASMTFLFRDFLAKSFSRSMTSKLYDRLDVFFQTTNSVT